ncbi:hypothetical protein BC628DRAFT_1404021 [Trametes gibbosa]|nr:hypothetical protein BC628DRAFT_1404021 [Trametes gibbosa]
MAMAEERGWCGSGCARRAWSLILLIVSMGDSHHLQRCVANASTGLDVIGELANARELVSGRATAQEVRGWARVRVPVSPRGDDDCVVLPHIPELQT